MIAWYDRQGNVIPGTDAASGSPEWSAGMRKAEKLLGDKAYKVIAQDLTPGEGFWISTVWLGPDHDFSYFDHTKPNPHPVIFETMVFDKRPGNQIKNDIAAGRTFSPDVDMDRYRSEVAAVAGHKRMLKRWTAKEAKLNHGKK